MAATPTRCPGGASSACAYTISALRRDSGVARDASEGDVDAGSPANAESAGGSAAKDGDSMPEAETRESGQSRFRGFSALALILASRLMLPRFYITQRLGGWRETARPRALKRCPRRRRSMAMMLSHTSR